MLKLVRRRRHFSNLDNIIFIFFSLIVFQIFSLGVCFEDLSLRLSRDVVPVSYVLRLQPDFRTELFNGEVAIVIEILAERRFIALHAKDLTITSTRLSKLRHINESSTIIGEMEIRQFFILDEYEMIVVETMDIMSPGEYRLRIRFNGTMSKNSRGIFMTSYVDPYTGARRKIAVTCFEPTNARRAFPCFDEPRLKAIFDIRLVQPNIPGYQSLSNMPCKELKTNVPLRGLTTAYFEPSLPMSTYLVAFLISDLVNRTSVIAKRWDQFGLIPMSAWSTVERIASSLDLVLHMTYRALDLHMRLFRMNYPLPKIDMVAVPGVHIGTMQNWGLVMYGEPSMLYYARSNSIDDLKICTNRISYGIFHMWFGGLVTIDWWNDVWIVKGFATYMQYYTTNWSFPEWKEIENFIIDEKFPSMMKGALASSQPIAPSALISPTEIEDFLQPVSYKKSASILRMLHHLMGEKNFFRGVASYLRLYRFNTTISTDFFRLLQKYHRGKENLTRFVETWTIQPGFPVLNVNRVGNRFLINQTRYVCNNTTNYNSSDSPYRYRWDLPIYYITNTSNGTKRIFLPYRARRVQLLVDKQVIWVKFNANSIGYYTVNYDEQTWEIFSNLLSTNPEIFRPIDRADLINDAFVNADAGRTPYRVPLAMLDCMKLDKDFITWQLVSDKLLKMHMLLRGTGVFDNFQRFVINLVSSIYETVGWYVHPRNSYLRRRLRIAILKLACAVGMESCIEEVTRRFRFWMLYPSIRPHPDVKAIIYYYGMLNVGGQSDWNIVYDLFMVEPDPQERHRLMISLTAIQNSSTLVKFLMAAKNSNVSSPDEYLTIIHAAALNPTGSLIVWNFYKKNWSFFTSRYGPEDRQFARLIIPVTSNFRENYKFIEILEFFKKYPIGETNVAARKEATEIIRNNIAWMETNYRQLTKWFDEENQLWQK